MSISREKTKYLIVGLVLSALNPEKQPETSKRVTFVKFPSLGYNPPTLVGKDGL